MLKRIITVTLAFCLMFALAFQPVGHAGYKFNPIPDYIGPPGTITIGDIPAHPDPEKPVIVFVQGLTNSSAAWYDGNDMYERARLAGYETAFVELYDSAGTPKSYWDNGLLLADMLEDISAFFNGKKLAIIGYSKGGVDAQTALVHYGKHHLVSEVITIGSPHYGSELADLAYSSWTWWLAALLGSRNEGTESLQTGNMNYFRSITDNKPEVNQNKYYTIAGNHTGSIFSATWWGGIMIPGESDGVVSVVSAHLPYGHMLQIGRWTHATVHLGANAYPVFHEHLSVSKPSFTSSDFSFVEKNREDAFELFVRGGEQSGMAEETFYVENDVDTIVINWLSTEKHDTVELFSPEKNSRESIEVTAVEDTAFFNGAFHHQVEVKKPAVGEWKIRTYSQAETAYAFVVAFDSKLNSQLHLSEKKINKNWQLTADVDRGQSTKNTALDVAYQYQFTPADSTSGIHHSGKKEGVYRQGRKEAAGNTVSLNAQEPGAYNLTIDIEGVTPAGEKFQRTIIKSSYIDEQGNIH
ncbi:triacylglycerol lipase [Evansella caseinilytica]|uniref:Triacylglycerol lipase n=1 Tax=Evansella caseinilytica TaxID=1503961 RepID=A0A1H3SCJ0_9BACI|nr:hypothetical protein [Evansella caseinilytica]SDZ35271.1 triacylglycerol lipase [Evansella caseinilytica]